jgi:hypothetical protein
MHLLPKFDLTRPPSRPNIRCLANTIASFSARLVLLLGGGGVSTCATLNLPIHLASWTRPFQTPAGPPHRVARRSLIAFLCVAAPFQMVKSMHTGNHSLRAQNIFDTLNLAEWLEIWQPCRLWRWRRFLTRALVRQITLSSSSAASAAASSAASSAASQLDERAYATTKSKSEGRWSILSSSPGLPGIRNEASCAFCENDRCHASPRARSRRYEDTGPELRIPRVCKNSQNIDNYYFQIVCLLTASGNPG